MRLWLLILIILCCSTNVFTQEIDYEFFKGEPVEMSMDLSMKKFHFGWINHPDISNEKKLKIRTITPPKKTSYAPSTRTLVRKLYHATTKADIEALATDKVLAKRHKIKKVKDYNQNHYLLEYQLSFDFGDKRAAVIKYSEVEKGQIIGQHTIQAILLNGWKVTEMKELMDIEHMVNTLNAEAFLAFYRTYDSNDKDIDALRAKVRSPLPSNRLNLTKLAEELRKLPQNNPVLWKKLQSM